MKTLLSLFVSWLAAQSFLLGLYFTLRVSDPEYASIVLVWDVFASSVVMAAMVFHSNLKTPKRRFIPPIIFAFAHLPVIAITYNIVMNVPSLKAQWFRIITLYPKITAFFLADECFFAIAPLCLGMFAAYLFRRISGLEQRTATI